MKKDTIHNIKLKISNILDPYYYYSEDDRGIILGIILGTIEHKVWLIKSRIRRILRRKQNEKDN